MGQDRNVTIPLANTPSSLKTLSLLRQRACQFGGNELPE